MKIIKRLREVKGGKEKAPENPPPSPTPTKS
jgi:hypothetical protein